MSLNFVNYLTIKKKILQKQTPKVLVIRFSSIGDIVLTTPVIRALKQQLNAEVHFLTKRNFVGVLSANPYIDRIWAIDKKINEVGTALKQQKFSAVIDLHANLRTLHLRMYLWQTPVFRFNKLNWQKWLLVKLNINRMPDVHIVDRYLAAAQPLGISNDQKGLDYFIPKQDEVKPTDYGLRSPYIALVTGAAHATKRMPLEKLIEICQSTTQQIVLLGGPDEKDQGEAIVAATGSHVINACGQARLHQSASLLRQSSFVITHDTGLMHIAAAFRLPIVSVWGNTVPEFGMYPYLLDNPEKSIMMQVPDLSCRPCSKIGYNQCPKGHFDCMQQQKVVEILETKVWARS